MPDFPLLLTPAWHIELNSVHPVATFAAQELRKLLAEIGGPTLEVRQNAEGPRLLLRHGEGGDGFAREAGEGGLILWGEGPRGLLYAVYDLLETLGCRWVAPDEGGTFLPRLARVELPRAPKRERPALRGRCLILGHDIFLDQAEGWIVWAAHNRLNSVFVHTTDRDFALAACRFSRWKERRAALLPLLWERGLTLELGGHGLPDLVPRTLFGAHPEAFRMAGRRRTPDYNFCPSSEIALEALRENGRQFFLENPEADVYHLWPDDLAGGGWCECERCKGDSPSDQSLKAVNALAEALAQVNPLAKLSHVAYHDTQRPPSRVRPRANVVLCYAPRVRTYARGLADPQGDVNPGLWRDWLENAAWFEASGSSGHQVFEYYLDGLLFKSALPPLVETMRADLRAYAASGAHTVQALLTGDRPWLSVPPNAYLFARLSWNPEQDPRELLREYVRVRAPQATPALLETYRALEAAWQPILDFQKAEQTISYDAAGRLDWIARPLLDVLDYMGAPQELRERHWQKMASVPAALARGRAAWRAVQAADFTPSLKREKAEWDCAELLLCFLWRRQRLYVLDGRGAPRQQLAAAIREARAPLAQSDEWGAAHLSGRRVRANFFLIRAFANLQLEHLFDLRLARPWQRIWARVRVHARLLQLVRTVRTAR